MRDCSSARRAAVAAGGRWSLVSGLHAPSPPTPTARAHARAVQLLERYGIEQITKDDKKLIMGENYARMIGLDIEKAKAAFAGDEFDTAVKENGIGEPWSYWRKNDPVWDGVQG